MKKDVKNQNIERKKLKKKRKKKKIVKKIIKIKNHIKKEKKFIRVQKNLFTDLYLMKMVLKF